VKLFFFLLIGRKGYKEMAYSNIKAFRRYSKKVSKKKVVYKKKTYTTPTKKLVKLIRKIALKGCETKNTHVIVENNNLFHNSQYIVNGLLATTYGTGDDNSGLSANNVRLGDQVIARGLSIKLWFANKLDRPNVMYKIIIFRYQSNDNPSDIFLSQSTTNIMLRDFDTEKYSIIAQKTFNLQIGASGTFPVGTDATKWSEKEAHRYVKFYIPLKNKQIKYNNNSQIPKFKNIGFMVAPYDSYGTLTTDNIASFAYNYKFYFKDP